MLNYVQANSNSHCVYDFDTDSIHPRARLPLPRIPGDLCRTGYTSREEKVSTKTGIIMLAVYVTRLPASSIPYLNLNTPACRRSASPSLGNARALLLQHGISLLVAPTSSRMLHRFIFHLNIFVRARTRSSYLLLTEVTPCLVPASRRLETLSESFPIISRGTSNSDWHGTQ